MALASSRDAAAERGREPFRATLLLLLVPLGLLAFLGLPLAIRITAVEAFEFEGPSMEPTLFAYERFTVDKSEYGLFLPLAARQSRHWRLPQLGDVVVLRNPADSMDIVKRVVGLPRDRIECRALDVLRNGRTLTTAQVACPASMSPGPATRRCFREQVGDRKYTVAYGRPMFESPLVTVPSGHVYVLGDNRANSNDSRNPALGPIAGELMKGRATRIYWSDRSERRLMVIE